MTLSEINTMLKRVEKLAVNLEPEQEIKIICCWGDEDIPADSDTIGIKTSWAGGSPL